MTSADWRVRAAAVRSVPLEAVLLLHGAVRDTRDESNWHIAQGSLSVTGVRFFNWCQGTGGGGAIDLVMHLARMDFRSAVAWIEWNFAAEIDNGPDIRHKAAVADSAFCRDVTDQVPLSSGNSAGSSESSRESAVQTAWRTEAGSGQLCLPVADPRRLGQVRRYLTGARRLPDRLVDRLIESGTLYVDQRGNAVFLLEADTANTPVGAELRGTGSEV